ncbi:acyl-CoA carboxylase epsilon subunit [Streptomyces sp. NPDC015171]|uniref:acyl-CoA carboxylase epsilon subunit n=1 Tax=Streptomyces sp. NPDC015171 TaxID=3364945 RepID=UPI0036F8B4AB
MLTAHSGPIRVIKGRATAEELAALTAVLLARTGRRPAVRAGAARRARPARRFVPPRAFHGAHSWQR